MDKIKKLIEMANTQFHDDYVEQQKKDLSEINQRGLGTSGLRFDIQKKTLFEYIKLTLNYKVELFEENLDYLIKTQQLDSFLKWFREHVKTYSNATFNTFVSNVKRDCAKFQLNGLGLAKGLRRTGKFELSRIQGEINYKIENLTKNNIS